MEIIFSGRRSGKTVALIKLCHEQDGYIVCRSMKEADRIYQLARSIGYPISLPISYDEFIKKEYHAAGIRGFYIDNVEELLRKLSLTEIKGITLSNE